VREREKGKHATHDELAPSAVSACVSAHKHKTAHIGRLRLRSELPAYSRIALMNNAVCPAALCAAHCESRDAFLLALSYSALQPFRCC
jgi:hypothetical protein